MGNGIVCRYQRICKGEENCVQKNSLHYSNSTKINNQSKPQNPKCLEKPQIDNNTKSNISRSITEAKPSPKLISSNESYNNFFHILNHIIKIQRAYRRYIFRIKSKSQALPKASLAIAKNIPEALCVDYPINDEANNLISDSNAIISKKPLSIIRSNTSLFFSRTLSSMSEAAMADGSLKGYFLKKNCKFTHKGGLLNKQKEGFGKVIWEDGSILYACFENSRAQGYCKFIDANCCMFTGLYENNKPYGYGVCSFKNINVKYEGYWSKNHQFGIGIEAWDDESYYQGEYDNSKKKGVGLYRWSDGTIYRGEWNENKMNGYGLIHYSDDRVYTGQVSNGEINGHGMFTWKDGGRYIGHYMTEQKQGFGAFIWNKKPISAYVGFWLDGKQHGVGLKITNMTSKYGLWKDGRLDCWLPGHWVIKRHLKPDQFKYEKFLGKSHTIIMKLFNP